MMRRVFVLMLILMFFQLSAQDIDSLYYQYNKEVRLVVDNDVFISLTRDAYYSSGLFGYFRHLKRTDDQVKVIRSYSINQRIYTPRSLGWRNVEDFDRPYAGHLSVFFVDEFYKREDIYFKTKYELGWMGPGTLTGVIQENWHGYFGLPTPRGWDYQVQNSPILNFYGTFAKTLLTDNGLDFIAETNAAAGTAFTHIRQEVMFRIGKIKSINKSVQYNGQLGEKVAKKRNQKTLEAYFFYSPGVEYNINNTTIEGNWFGPNAPHVENATRWLWQNRLGFMISWPSFDIEAIFYGRTPETDESIKHKYLGLHLNKRF